MVIETEMETKKTTLARWGNLRITALNELVLVEHVGNNALAAPYAIAVAEGELQTVQSGYYEGYKFNEAEKVWLKSERIQEIVKQWLR